MATAALEQAMEEVAVGRADRVSERMHRGYANLHEALLDAHTAAAHFAEQLRLSREHAVHWMAAEGIGGLAAIAARQDETERAACLLGGAESLANILDDAAGVRLEQEFFTAAP